MSHQLPDAFIPIKLPETKRGQLNSFGNLVAIAPWNRSIPYVGSQGISVSGTELKPRCRVVGCPAR
ncbi:hypothetical protein [Puniceibacterium confluentis]|uniref:hypothetical protein n=1 Tax=Puniceibacterium confluentis TaxID=1958944 RepID=UPI0011B4E771|nr:hypothetical protein [Puniceibacterium confluentis]